MRMTNARTRNMHVCVCVCACMNACIHAYKYIVDNLLNMCPEACDGIAMSTAQLTSTASHTVTY